MCIDTAMVLLLCTSNGEECGNASEVLVPTVRETEISLLLAPHLLDPHIHYNGYISFNSQHSIFINFC